MKRLCVLFALAMVFAFGLKTPMAHADLFFCEGDPIINVNGHNVSIYDGVLQSAAFGHFTGTAQMIVVVPEGVAAHFVSDTPIGFEESVNVIHSFMPKNQFKVFLTIPTDQNYAATIWTPGQPWVYGLTNHVLELDIPIPRH